MTNQTLDARVWQLIYGGLIGVVISVFLSPEMATTALVLQVLGALAVVIGIALIVVRSRRKDSAS